MSHHGSTSQSNSGHSTPHPPPPGANLPARPPPSTVSNNTNASASANAAFGAFKPRSVAAPIHASAQQAPGTYSYGAAAAAAAAAAAPASSYGMSYSQYSPAPTAQTAYPSAYSAAAAPPAQTYYQQSYGAGAGYPAQTSYANSPPQIKNPFAPPPGKSVQGSLYGTGYDPEYEAQIQQWQSAYVSRDESKGNLGKSGKGEGAASAGGANALPLGATRTAGPATMSAPATTTAAGAAAAGAATVTPPAPGGKRETVIRSGGGQQWEDPTLLEWGNHPRLFVGNLAGEVTDESLLKAFSKYPSVQKARVIRDKRTTKSKGFGFVSLANTDEFFQAAKEMQGKYIGSHPVLIKRAETEIKVAVKKDDRRHGKNNKNKTKSQNKSGAAGEVLGPNTSGGVQKKAANPGKYKVLG